MNVNTSNSSTMNVNTSNSSTMNVNTSNSSTMNVNTSNSREKRLTNAATVGELITAECFAVIGFVFLAQKEVRSAVV